MLKLKEVQKKDIPLNKKRYGEKMMLVDEFIKSNMQACLIENDGKQQSNKSLSCSLRTASRLLGVSITILVREEGVYMIKKETEGKNK